MDINDKLQPVGHLEIIKRLADGTEELLFEDKNVICSGLSQSIAQYMTKQCSPINDPRSGDICKPLGMPGQADPNAPSQDGWHDPDGDPNDSFNENSTFWSDLGRTNRPPRFVDDEGNSIPASVGGNPDRGGLTTREPDEQNCCLGFENIKGKFDTTLITSTGEEFDLFGDWLDAVRDAENGNRPRPGVITLVRFEGEITVTTKTTCLDIKCEGRTWEGIFWLSCDNEVEEFNKPRKKPFIVQGALNSLTWEYHQCRKLGCCDHPCPDQYTTPQTHHIRVEVAAGRGSGVGSKERQLLSEAILSQYGPGGTSDGTPDGDDQSPQFKKCCKKEEEAEPEPDSPTQPSTPGGGTGGTGGGGGGY